MPASSATMGGQIAAPRARDLARTRCLHCESPLSSGQDDFCCTGCREVHEMLQGRGLLRYYELSQGAGVPARERGAARSDDKWIDLAERELAGKDGIALTSLDVDGLHCTACVWLIQELFKRTGAPGRVDVNTARGSLDLFIEPSFPLRDFVREVEAFGYRLGPKRKHGAQSGELLLRMGIAIAVAMNAMIFSISIYAGLATGALFALFQYAILGLSLISLWVGGSVFIKSAALGLRRRVLHLDLPIALGIVLGFAGSAYAMFATAGEHAYFDTLTVFIALMLVGRFLRERVLDQIGRAHV